MTAWLHYDIKYQNLYRTVHFKYVKYLYTTQNAVSRPLVAQVQRAVVGWSKSVDLWAETCRPLTYVVTKYIQIINNNIIV